MKMVGPLKSVKAGVNCILISFKLLHKRNERTKETNERNKRNEHFPNVGRKISCEWHY